MAMMMAHLLLVVFVLAHTTVAFLGPVAQLHPAIFTKSRTTLGSDNGGNLEFVDDINTNTIASEVLNDLANEVVLRIAPLALDLSLRSSTTEAAVEMDSTVNNLLISGARLVINSLQDTAENGLGDGTNAKADAILREVSSQGIERWQSIISGLSEDNQEEVSWEEASSQASQQFLLFHKEMEADQPVEAAAVDLAGRVAQALASSVARVHNPPQQFNDLNAYVDQLEIEPSRVNFNRARNAADFADVLLDEVNDPVEDEVASGVGVEGGPAQTRARSMAVAQEAVFRPVAERANGKSLANVMNSIAKDFEVYGDDETAGGGADDVEVHGNAEPARPETTGGDKEEKNKWEDLDKSGLPEGGGAEGGSDLVNPGTGNVIVRVKDHTEPREGAYTGGNDGIGEGDGVEDKKEPKDKDSKEEKPKDADPDPDGY